MTKSRKYVVRIAAVMVLAILLTRALDLTHNMELHGDEHVFFNAAQSLKGYLFGSSPIFEEEKEYPEGAYVFQLPFHVLSAIYYRVTGNLVEPRISGRIASVFYFTLGAVFAYILICRFFSKRPECLISYALIVVFSLFHIEQSRYGTGDPISFFLLTAVILLTAMSLSAEKHGLRYLFAAFFLSGSLCAVKYPLIFFAAVPASGAVMFFKGRHERRAALKIIGMVLVLYLGFAVCSPKAAFDPMYIYRASTRELEAYTGTGLSSAYAKSNFMLLLTYSSLYSGFPFAPFFMVGSFIWCWKNTTRTPVEILLKRIVPLLIIVFTAYNLFVVFFVMRTFYPFYFLSDIYIALAVGNWLCSSRGKRIVVTVLGSIMILRGAYLIIIMADHSGKARIAQIISDAVDENWDTTTLLSGQILLPDSSIELKNLELIDIKGERFQSKENAELKKGELFISGAWAYSREPFVFTFMPRDPVTLDGHLLDESIMDNCAGTGDLAWAVFAEVNEEYLVAKPYPDYYYFLFGYWLKGTTGTGAEFPTCYIYYRSD